MATKPIKAICTWKDNGWYILHITSYYSIQIYTYIVPRNGKKQSLNLNQCIILQIIQICKFTSSCLFFKVTHFYANTLLSCLIILNFLSSLHVSMSSNIIIPPFCFSCPSIKIQLLFNHNK